MFLFLFLTILKADNNLLFGQSPNESLLQPMVNKFVVNEVIEFKPLENHHFNLKANNNCQVMPPKKQTEKIVQCQLDRPGNYTASLFVCDDANTFCKMERIKFEVTAPRGYESAKKKRVSSNILFVPKASLPAPPGFIKNKDKFAIEQAKKKDQLILIAFAAQWCPACNMLDENVFRSKGFQEDSKNIVKLILDVDSDLSWDLKDRFRVGGYPTTILATSTLNEISRVVGYRSPKRFSSWLKENIELKNEPIEFALSKIIQLKNSSKDTPFEGEYNKKVLRVANWYLEKSENERVLSLIEGFKGKEFEKIEYLARLNIAKKINDKDKVVKNLELLLENFEKDVEYVFWLSELSANDVSKAKKYTKEMDENIKNWNLSSDKDALDYTLAELYYAAGDVYQNVGMTAEAKRQFANCALEYEKLEKLSLIERPRGAPLERAFCLTESGMTDEALRLFERLAQAYKSEFGFNFYYARALHDSNQSQKALLFARRALDGSYGDNFIRASNLKAQIEMKIKDFKAAEKTLESALSKIYLPGSTQIRTHRYVSSLKGTLNQLGNEKLKEKKQ